MKPPSQAMNKVEFITPSSEHDSLTRNMAARSSRTAYFLPIPVETGRVKRCRKLSRLPRAAKQTPNQKHGSTRTAYILNSKREFQQYVKFWSKARDASDLRTTYLSIWRVNKTS
ncbi:hypothetical protein R1flu_010050 [Riccia fluitans]|uniref:Uncharacterized protein n=1 Tax=Riccia fluitans TaxID=41844 RepID=A0ABD1Z3W3_9MARC